MPVIPTAGDRDGKPWELELPRPPAGRDDPRRGGPAREGLRARALAVADPVPADAHVPDHLVHAAGRLVGRVRGGTSERGGWLVAVSLQQSSHEKILF